MVSSTHWMVSAGTLLGLASLGFSSSGFWTLIGWLGNTLFSCRFLVQWFATEKKKQVTVPVLFWWLSLAGSLMLLLYALFYDKHHVIIFAYAFPWIPYTRNLIIHYRHLAAQKQCPGCGEKCNPRANFCANCGAKLAATVAE